MTILALFLMLLVLLAVFLAAVGIAKLFTHFDWVTALSVAPMILLLWIATKI